MQLLELLNQSMPYPLIGTAIIVFLVLIRNWSYVKRFAHDFWNIMLRVRALILLRTKYNPAFFRAFDQCRSKEPVLQIYKDFIPLKLEESKIASKIKIRLEEGIAIASIPSLSMDNIAQAVHQFFTQHVSASSLLGEYEELQKAIDLWATTQVIKATNLDGAFSIAMRKILNSALKDEKVKWAFDVVSTTNEELKKLEHHLDERLLRILLIETCREEFNAFGGVFP